MKSAFTFKVDKQVPLDQHISLGCLSEGASLCVRGLVANGVVCFS